MKNSAQKPLFIIDGSSFLYRAYYGLRPLHTPDGLPVQAVYGFCRMIKKIIDTFDPQYMALVWDSKGKTERHELFPEYKGTRQAPPNDLFLQKELIQEFANTIGLMQLQKTGIEADDLMYSLALWWQKEKKMTYIITSDKDMGQTISDSIVLYDSFNEQVIDAQAFQEKMGFSPDKTIFYFSLVGDSSDNIPGVKGIGKKGALDLVTSYNSLEELYETIDTVTPARAQKALITHKQEALLSEKLFTLKQYPLTVAEKELEFKKEAWNNAQPFFEKLHFKSFLISKPSQLSLFTPKTKAVESGRPALSYKTPTERGYTFETITTLQQLTQLVANLKKHHIFAYDTEGSGTDPLTMQVVGLSICYAEKKAYYIPFGHTTKQTQLSQQEVCAALKPFFENTSYKKIAHHAKFDQLMMHALNIEVNGLAFDTLLAAGLVKEEWQRASLKELSYHYLKEPMLTFEQVVTQQGYKNFAQVPFDIATEYAAADAHQTFLLYPLFEKMLKERGQDKLYYTIELPLVDILARMELAGIYCDKEVLKRLKKVLDEKLEQTHRTIVGLLPPEFETINLNSSKQVAHLLFDHLGLKSSKKSSKGEHLSTDSQALYELAKQHPIASMITEFRELAKLKNTYVEGLVKYINPKTGRIHTSFSQTRVSTGRLSSSDPNLQNIPVQGLGLQVRSAFKPEESSKIFISADYSQIELRVLAYLSQDARLLKAFKEGHDIHAETASALFDTPLTAVTKEQRSIGKRINFSILYGLTPYGLSKDLDIPLADAKKYITTYFEQYPKVRVWMDEVIRKTEILGYTETFFGRRRYLPGIHEKNKTLKDLACRLAINTVGQGTAAEIMKLGMIAVTDALATSTYAARLLLQIHDELLLEVEKKDAAAVGKLIKEKLESVVSWNVALQVNVDEGANWQEVS